MKRNQHMSIVERLILSRAWLVAISMVVACLPAVSIAAESPGEAMFRKLDASGDGILSLGDATVGTRSYLQRIFKEAGKEQGGEITRVEFLAVYERLRSAGASATGKSAARGEPEAGASAAPAEGFGFVDTSGDGAISRGEWSKFSQAFSRLDSDKDNSLSAGELEVTGELATLVMALADANGDGSIARVEWAKLVHSFARLDTNRDGTLAREELEQAAATAEKAASGSASLSSTRSGPTRWRGNIEGRGQIELVVDGTNVSGRELGGRGENLGSGTVTMTGDGKSGNMDAIYTDGGRRGEVCLGIYRLEGNTLVWCVNNRGARPQGFYGGGGNWLLTLTRTSAP